MPTLSRLARPAHGRAFARERRPFRPWRRSGQSGASAVEFAIVAIPLWLAALGGIEIAHWFSVRQAVSLALLEAARAASVAHAKPEVIEHAFEQALLPLFAGTDQTQTQRRLADALRQRKEATGQAPWRIVIHSPPASAYADYAQPHLAIDGLATIDNHYQQEQDERYRRQGWTDGKGPLSQLTIFQANTLDLTLTYLHQPALPGLSGLLAQLVPATQPYAQAALRQGYLPMTRSLSLIMQSHPVDWPSPPGGKIVHANDRRAAESVAHSYTGQQACAGAWCLHPLDRSRSGTPVSANVPASPLPGADGARHPAPMPSAPASGHSPAPAGGHVANGGSVASAETQMDILCGVTLCCGQD